MHRATLLERHMSKRLKILLGGAIAAVVILVAGGVGVWYFFIRSDAPPEVTLADAVGSIATTIPGAAAGAPAATSSATAAASAAASQPASGSPGGGPPGGGPRAAPSVAAPALPSAAAAAATGIAGTWIPDPAQASFVGYRVEEELRAIGSTTAVGRTSAVTGEAVIAGASVTSAKFTGDMTQLKSDSSMRDGQLRNQGIEYAKFPTSTFELSEPIALPAGLAAGQAITVTMKGKFTLHGVTKDVSIPAQAQVAGSNLVVVGSLKIAFADYNVEKPRAGSVLSIKDDAIMELQLILKKQ